MIKTSPQKSYDENLEKEIEKFTPQEFRQELNRKKDELINFQPPKPTRQTRAKTSSKVAKNISGWRRGFF
jgi:ribosomal protein L29